MPDTKMSHIPVLQNEVLAVLFVSEVRAVFDGTLGLGGHAELILQKFPNIRQYIACDLDEQHLTFAQKRLSQWHEKTSFHHKNFSQIKEILSLVPAERPLMILLDLGLCSHHVDNPDKGFSFQQDGPLSMAFDAQHTATNAQSLLKEATLDELTHIFRAYGEEPLARKIAQHIDHARQETPLTTTGQLRGIIESCTHPKDRNKTLMRVFQALRIAVNDELSHLQKTLEDALEIMQSGDRIGVISYHALEDKIVKDFFRIQSRPRTQETEFSLHTPVAPAQGKLITKKPIAPSPEEIADNPRSRSARFRVLEKI